MAVLNTKDITQFLTFIRENEGKSTVSELRFLTHSGRSTSRLFSNPLKGLSIIEEMHKRHAEKLKGIYVTINPIKRDLLGNRSTARDRDISHINFIAIDIDSVKAETNQSATEREKYLAKQLAQSLCTYLKLEGFEKPDLIIDSGNGYHIYYRTEVIENMLLTSEFLKALSSVKSTAHAKIDTSVGNPSRIMRIPGTYARKGENTEERPWRLSKIIEEGQL